MLCNVFLITAAVAGSVIYANNVRASQVETKALDFISTVESMKSVSQNYLDSERGYVENWAAYINEQQNDIAEALEFLRNINTNPARFIHIVDMDTFDAWTASYPPGKEQIDTYHQYQGELTEWEQAVADSMMEAYNGTASQFQMVGRYQLEETLAPGSQCWYQNHVKERERNEGLSDAAGYSGRGVKKNLGVSGRVSVC